MVIAALMAAVAVVLLTAGCGGSEDQVHFQNASDPGPKPFTPPTDVPKASASTSEVSSSTSSSGSSADPSSSGSSSSGSSSAGSSSSGSSSSSSSEPQKPGAFTKRNTVCDREKLIAELNLDPDKRAAWAEAVGIDSDQQSVAEFIRKLKPSTLTRDTQVTTHSYEGGKAKEYQAILRKGTAVLVDESGKPVARCICGNPLSEPSKLADNTKCFNCPANYQPPPKCEDGNCFREEPNPPPVTGGGGKPVVVDPKPGDPITEAKAALDKCRKDKGSLEQCKAEYEKARGLCAANPLNTACDASVCFDGIVTVNGASDGCSSYLPTDSQSDSQVFCKTQFGDAPAPAGGGDTPEQACRKNLDALKKKCIADPTQADCKVDPNIKIFHSRQQCTANPGRPECGAVLGACQKNPQFGCEQFVNKVNELKQKCAANAALPECKSIPVVPKFVASALALKGEGLAPDQQGTDQGGAGTGDTGQGTGGDTGTSGGETTTQETTPPETTTQETTPQQP